MNYLVSANNSTGYVVLFWIVTPHVDADRFKDVVDSVNGHITREPQSLDICLGVYIVKWILSINDDLVFLTVFS